MKFILKFSLVLLGTTILWRIALAQVLVNPGVMQVTHLSDHQKFILLEGKGRQWLSIETHNGKQWNKDGYDPVYTRVVSDYKPMMHKLPTGQYELVFTSELAQDLP